MTSRCGCIVWSCVSASVCRSGCISRSLRSTRWPPRSPHWRIGSAPPSASCSSSLPKSGGRPKSPPPSTTSPRTARASRSSRRSGTTTLNKLAKYVRLDSIDELERVKLLQLITLEVHARDVIDRLRQTAKVREKFSIHSFEWMSQLRFYYVKEMGEYGMAVIKQTNTSFTYRYEYIANEGRLVITPLTDRCYITLTTALHLALGGSPVGPAGTGKVSPTPPPATPHSTTQRHCHTRQIHILSLTSTHACVLLGCCDDRPRR